MKERKASEYIKVVVIKSSISRDENFNVSKQDIIKEEKQFKNYRKVKMPKRSEGIVHEGEQ